MEQYGAEQSSTWIELADPLFARVRLSHELLGFSAGDVADDLPDGGWWGVTSTGSAEREDAPAGL